MPAQYYPVLLCLGVALALGGVLLGLSYFVGRKEGGKVKLSTYESGLPLLDRSRKRISILFFVIALDFVVFDVETAFLYPWVYVIREGGYPLFFAVLVFFALLIVGYVYLWKKGGLDLKPGRTFSRS